MKKLTNARRRVMLVNNILQNAQVSSFNLCGVGGLASIYFTLLLGHYALIFGQSQCLACDISILPPGSQISSYKIVFNTVLFISMFTLLTIQSVDSRHFFHLILLF